MLDAMQIESKRWPKLNDLEKSFSTAYIMPQTVLNYTEYQEKIQRLAFYAEQGDNEAMQKLLDKEDVMAKKNSFMQPIFRDIKTTIKHMTYTPEYKLMREYMFENDVTMMKIFMITDILLFCCVVRERREKNCYFWLKQPTVGL